MSRWQALVELLSLLGIEFVVWRKFRGRLDLNVWDEAHYLRQGADLLAGDLADVSYAWSPPLTALYAALVGVLERSPSWFGLAGVIDSPSDVVTLGLSVAATLALWWGLAPLLGRPGAWCAAALWALSSTNAHMEGAQASSYVLGLALASVAVGAFARGWGLAGLVIFSIAIANRGELGLWGLAAGVILLASAIPRGADSVERRPSKWRRVWLGGALVTVGAAFTIALQSGWRAGQRIWLSFRQHFAWADPDGRNAADVFAGAESMGDAVRAAPSEFIAHVGRNMVDVPRVLAQLIGDVLPWNPAAGAAARWTLVVLVVVGLLSRRRPTVASSDGYRARDAAVARLFLAGSPAVLVSIVLLMPRPPLLVPLFPLVAVALLAAVALAVERLTESLGARPRRFLAFVLPLAGVGLVVASGGPGVRGAPTPARAAVRLLREHVRVEPRPAGSEATVLGPQAEALLAHAGLWDARAVNPLASSELGLPAEWEGLSVQELAHRAQAEWVVVLPLDRMRDTLVRELDREVRSERWEHVGAEGDVALYRRSPSTASGGRSE